MVVIVAGMHRTGTSLIASILVSLGVHMGDKMLKSTSSQPYGHWEDVDFYQMNKRILREAGGNWRRPPPPHRILKLRQPLSKPVEGLLKAKIKDENWGWKDPRNCLTLPLYHPHLESPTYIKVIRDQTDTINSLIKRSGGNYREWRMLYETYYDRLNVFLAGKTYAIIEYEKINPLTITALNDFIKGNGEIEEALKRVRT